MIGKSVIFSRLKMDTKINKNKYVSFLKGTFRRYSLPRTVLDGFLGGFSFKKHDRRFFLGFILILSFLFFFKPEISQGASSPFSISSITTDNQANLYPATNAIDGNPATFWHTDSSSQPHYLILDLGNSYSVNSFHYLPRQDGSTGGVITGYEIYVSENKDAWGNAVAANTFASNMTEKEISFTAKTGRYVKFVSLSNIKGNGSAVAAEVEINGLPTILNNIGGPEIAVGLWSYTKDSLNATPFKAEANKKYNIKNSAGAVIASVENNVITRVAYVSNQNFKVYNSIPETLVNKEVIFEAADGNNSDMIFDIYRPASTYDQYRGKIKIRYTDSNNIWVINTLPMEHYTWGMGETTGTGPMEHTKLMTTIFRTYGYWYMTYATKYLPYGFRIKSDSGNQIYRGYDWETTYPNIKIAAAATKGKIVTYKNDIALTPYSSWTDGRTRSFQERWGSTEYPWCKSVADPYGKHSTMTTAQLEAAGNHMVGVSANGSVKLAGNSYNWDYAKILKYYYTRIDITSKY